MAFHSGFVGCSGAFILWIVWVLATESSHGGPTPDGSTIVFGIIFSILWMAAFGAIVGFVFAIVRALFHLAGPWFLPPLVVSPTLGVGIAYICRDLSARAAAAVTWPVFVYLAGIDQKGVVVAPIIAVVLVGSALFFAALFFLLGAAIGLGFTLPPLLWGIVKRMKTRAEARRIVNSTAQA